MTLQNNLRKLHDAALSQGSDQFWPAHAYIHAGICFDDRGPVLAALSDQIPVPYTRFEEWLGGGQIRTGHDVAQLIRKAMDEAECRTPNNCAPIL